MSALSLMTLLVIGAFAENGSSEQQIWPFNRGKPDDELTEDEVDDLEEQEQNLTDDVQDQAVVVSDASDTLKEKKDYAENLPTTEELENASRKASAAADKAENQSAQYLSGVAMLKYKRDAYKNATDAAEEALAALEPKLDQTRTEYEVLRAGIPQTENASEDAEYEASKAGSRLAAAEAAGMVASQHVEYQRFLLQFEIEKLNEINAELRAVQEKLYGAGTRVGASLYLLVLLCGGLFAQHVH